MDPRSLRCRASQPSWPPGELKSWSCTGVTWDEPARSTSRCAGSGWADPRLGAFEVLLRPPATDSDGAEHRAVSLDQHRTKAGHDGHTDQAVDHAEEPGAVLG